MVALTEVCSLTKLNNFKPGLCLNWRLEVYWTYDCELWMRQTHTAIGIIFSQSGTIIFAQLCTLQKETRHSLWTKRRRLGKWVREIKAFLPLSRTDDWRRYHLTAVAAAASIHLNQEWIALKAPTTIILPNLCSRPTSRTTQLITLARHVYMEKRSFTYSMLKELNLNLSDSWIENAMNDSNFKYSNELKQRMNDSNASLGHSPGRMSEPASWRHRNSSKTFVSCCFPEDSSWFFI